MAQHDYIIANQSGASFRADLNNALAAAVSENSGAAEPSTTYAYMTWADTTTGLYKIRNGANSAWIPLYKLDGSGFSVANGTAAAPSIFFRDSGTDTGIYSSGTDAVDIATAGLRRVGVSSAGDVTIYGQGDLRFADNDSSNYVGLQPPSTVSSNVVFTLPSADGTARQSLVTDGAAALSFANRSELVLATALAATGSNSVFDFSSIPSWVKRITLMCYRVSTTANATLYAQIGSGSLQASGYSSTYWYASTGSFLGTTAFILSGTNSGYFHDLTCTLTLVGGNKWMLSGMANLLLATNIGAQAIGSVELSGTLDRLRFATDAGTFDAGTINILYEG